jgi:flagellar basal body-associated protein FliL
MQQIKSAPKLKKTISWILVVTFIIFSVAIILGGFLFYKSQRNRIFTENQNSLTAISALKIGQIEVWHKEKLANASTIMNNGPLIRSLKQFFNDDNQPELRGELLKWFM